MNIYNAMAQSKIAPKEVMFGGVIFTRQMFSKHKSIAEYYISGEGKLLHRVKYESVYGVIPRGCVIHHKDFNTFNNDLSNLEMMTNGQHTTLHKTGKSPSEATKKKISKGMIGIKRSDKTRNKMRKSQAKSKGVSLSVYIGNKFIGTYPSVRECARQLNLKQSNISATLNGTQKAVKDYSFYKN